MNYIGTSGWSYWDWQEKFYGKKLSSLEQLRFYASKFNTVEINYSFYHIPKAQSFKNWDSATPKKFTFSIKLNRQFTHVDRLILSAPSALKMKIFLQNAAELKGKFGALLIQLPKSLKFDIKLLNEFLKQISLILKKVKAKPRLAFEFRNEDWFNQKTFAALKRHRAASVIAQSSRYPENHKITTDFIYLRLHGPDKIFDSSYSHRQLKGWQEFITSHPETLNAFVYFNNTMNGRALNNGQYLQSLFKNRQNNFTVLR